VLDQNPFLHHEDVGRYPTGCSAEAGKASLNDHEIALLICSFCPVVYVLSFRFRVHLPFPDIRGPVKTRILAFAKRAIWIIVIIHSQD